jgi:hypothetical protein
LKKSALIGSVLPNKKDINALQCGGSGLRDAKLNSTYIEQNGWVTTDVVSKFATGSGSPTYVSSVKCVDIYPTSYNLSEYDMSIVVEITDKRYIETYTKGMNTTLNTKRTFVSKFSNTQEETFYNLVPIINNDFYLDAYRTGTGSMDPIRISAKDNSVSFKITKSYPSNISYQDYTETSNTNKKLTANGLEVSYGVSIVDNDTMIHAGEDEVDDLPF